MAASQNHWKLGIFVVAGLGLALAAVVVLGAASMQREVGLYTSYFDESVQGLEVGSPIKFRGVTIGTVGRIQVAPDHRHVEVVSELGGEALTRLGLDVAKGPTASDAPRKLEMTADLRLQLASSGLTGVKFLQLDFFDVHDFPPPELPFPVPASYIPTAPSMMKGLEDSLTSVASRLPEITERASSLLAELREIVGEVKEQHLPTRLVATLDALDSVLGQTADKVDQLDVAGLSRNANRVLGELFAAVSRADGLLADAGRDGGLLTSVERASDAVGDALHDVGGIGGELADTLASIRASARSIRTLTDALEQDPDMLLKGRSPEKRP